MSSDTPYHEIGWNVAISFHFWAIEHVSGLPVWRMGFPNVKEIIR